MRKTGLFIAIVLAALGTSAAQENLQPLPAPITNNAVVGVKVNGQTLVYSFMGLGPSKNPDAVKNVAYALNVRYAKWTTVRSCPSSRTRLFALRLRL